MLASRQQSSGSRASKQEHAARSLYTSGNLRQYGVPVAVTEGVALGVGVAVDVGVGVRVYVDVGVAVYVGVGVAVSLGVLVGVAVGITKPTTSLGRQDWWRFSAEAKPYATEVPGAPLTMIPLFSSGCVCQVLTRPVMKNSCHSAASSTLLV